MQIDFPQSGNGGLHPKAGWLCQSCYGMLVDLSLLQFPVHSHVAIVCSLKEYHGVGDHYLYICDVEQVYGDETRLP